jgi:hypothetical protein
MGEKSPIQWTDSSANPTMGCAGCELWRVIGLTREQWIKICYSGNDVVRSGDPSCHPPKPAISQSSANTLDGWQQRLVGRT